VFVRSVLEQPESELQRTLPLRAKPETFEPGGHGANGNAAVAAARSGFTAVVQQQIGKSVQVVDGNALAAEDVVLERQQVDRFSVARVAAVTVPKNVGPVF